ncbi:hypothetical protein G6F32_015701 [Rhizopus arrhizus]|nr:hypothetical protein G6F32_015701 [Rhizopus arrhizus]
MHLGAQLPEHVRRDVVGGAMRGVHHNLHAVQVEVVGERALAEFDVAALRIGHAARAAQALGGDAAQRLVQRGFDVGFDLVGQLHALRREELDAVVLVRVVRRADDDTRHQAQRPGQVGHGGRRDRPGQQHIDACGR